MAPSEEALSNCFQVEEPLLCVHHSFQGRSIWTSYFSNVADQGTSSLAECGGVCRFLRKGFPVDREVFPVENAAASEWSGEDHLSLSESSQSTSSVASQCPVSGFCPPPRFCLLLLCWSASVSPPC